MATSTAPPTSMGSADRWENEGGPTPSPEMQARDDLKAELKKYVDEEMQNQKIISKEPGQLDGMPAYFIKLPDDQRLVIVKSKSLIFHISYGPNDHKPTDKTLEEIFDRMMSSLKFNK